MISARPAAARPLFALLLIALFALSGVSLLAAQSADPAAPAEPTAAEAIPVDAFFTWRAWTPKTPEGNFDVNRCRTIESGDADGDGLDDLICAYNYGGATTRTFVQFSQTNRFTGWTNQHPTLISQFELDLCRPLLSGDINGDGSTDLICPYDYGLNTRTFVQLGPGPGQTTYTPWINWTGAGNNQFDLDRCANGVQVGDANGDGLADLLCAYNYGGATTRTFIQLSSGADLTLWTNQHATLIDQFELDNCRPLRTGDINGDGRADLICPYDYGLNTRTFVQLAPVPGSTFTPWINWTGGGNSQFDLDRCTNGVQVGDANGDGLADLLCAYNYGGATTRTFVQLSGGDDLTLWTSQHATLINQFEMNNCRPLVTGDINEDGRTDLICPYDYGLNTRTFVQLAPSPNQTTYTPWINWTGNGNSQFDLDNCAGIQVGNFNGDGLDDLACAYGYPNSATAAFVQTPERYRLALPSVLR